MTVGNYISISTIAQMLDVSTTTVKRWYKWYENDAFKKPESLTLPNYVYVDNRKTKFFHKDSVEQLMDFKNKLQTEYRGVMAEFNAEYQWGKAGKDRKEKIANEQNEGKRNYRRSWQ